MNHMAVRRFSPSITSNNSFSFFSNCKRDEKKSCAYFFYSLISGAKQELLSFWKQTVAFFFDVKRMHGVLLIIQKPTCVNSSFLFEIEIYQKIQRFGSKKKQKKKKSGFHIFNSRFRVHLNILKRFYLSSFFIYHICKCERQKKGKERVEGKVLQKNRTGISEF